MLFESCFCLLDVLSQVGQTHVALAQEGVVHGECCAERVLGVAAVLAGILQVVLEHGAIVGVCHLDEFLCLLHVALVAQVCHSVLGDDGIDEVVGVVNVAGKRNNAADGASLGG